MIKDIMSTHLVIGKHDDSLEEISNLMKKFDIGFIPISKDKHIIGVITDRDIVIRAISNNEKANKSVFDYISTNLISCDINDELTEILKVMSEAKVKRVLITDKEKLVGIVSISDIAYDTDVSDTIKNIYEIDKNENLYNTEIDEFYL